MLKKSLRGVLEKIVWCLWMMNRHKLKSLVAILLLVWFAHDVLNRPWVNWNPKHKVVLTGSFPYETGVELAMNVDYIAANPECIRSVKVFFLFEAAKTAPLITVDLPVRKIGPDRYETEVALDYYRPGRCQWQIGGLGYRVVSRAELRGEKKPFKGYVGFGAIPRYNQPAELTCKTKTYSTHPEPTLFCFASRMDATPVREFATVEAYPPVFNINFRFKG